MSIDKKIYKIILVLLVVICFCGCRKESDERENEIDMEEIQEELRTRGMHDGENEDGEGS